mgnify:CR=1 FL=1
MPEGPPPKAIGAQTVAHHLDRDRLVLVGEQRHFGNEWMDPRHLADHAGFVGHRAARLARPAARRDR